MSSSSISNRGLGNQLVKDPGRGSGWIGNILFWLFVVVVSFFFVVPLYILVKVSLSTLAQATAPIKQLTYWNDNPTLDNWRRLFDWGLIGDPLMHSVIVATATAIIAIIIAAPAAYVIARLPGGIKYGVILAVLFTRMFPEVIIATPIAERFFGWGLNDTDQGLVLAHLIRALPLTAWILIGSFEAIPIDLEESSEVDGAGKLSTLGRVVMPLALPGIAVAAMFAWLDSWNDLLYAVYLFLTEYTLPRLTYYYASRGNVTDVATFSVMMTIPVFVLTLFLQRYIKSGSLTGAVKG